MMGIDWWQGHSGEYQEWIMRFPDTWLIPVLLCIYAFWKPFQLPMVNPKVFINIFLISTGGYIPPSGSELLQDVWDCVRGPQEAGREAAGLPELLGHHNQDHRSAHHGSRGQHGTHPSTQGGLPAGMLTRIQNALKTSTYLATVQAKQTKKIWIDLKTAIRDPLRSHGHKMHSRHQLF